MHWWRSAAEFTYFTSTKIQILAQKATFLRRMHWWRSTATSGMVSPLSSAISATRNASSSTCETLETLIKP